MKKIVESKIIVELSAIGKIISSHYDSIVQRAILSITSNLSPQKLITTVYPGRMIS